MLKSVNLRLTRSKVVALKLNLLTAEKKLDEEIKACVPDLFILDIMLPGEDGLSILKHLRAQENTKNVPVIMLTAKSTELDKVKGLDLGADDYIAKPFGILEFVSQVRALLRRSGLMKSESEESTYKEYELLKLLLSHPGLVYSRQQILEKIWGVDFNMDTRTVDMHIKTLRQKLGEQGAIIQTVRNVGYKAQ